MKHGGSVFKYMEEVYLNRNPIKSSMVWFIVD